MTIFLDADHGGRQLKEAVRELLAFESYQCIDLGNDQQLPDDDYPPIAANLARRVIAEKDSFGVLFCRSGAGMAIAANRIKGARAIQGFDDRSTQHSREHNDANILTLSADWMSVETSVSLCRIFFSTPFSNEERHQRRIAQIDTL